MPIMTITPWCSLERPSLLARETGTRKIHHEATGHVEFCCNRTAIASFRDVRDPRRVDDAAERKPDFTTLGTPTTRAANAGLIVGTTPVAILVLAALGGP